MRPDRKDRPAAPAAHLGADAARGAGGGRPGEDAGRRGAGAGQTGLLDAWRRSSLASGWLTPGDWHSEAVDAVLAACEQGWLPSSGGGGLAVAGGRMAVACAGLGRSRAQAGTGIAETIDDLAALFAVLEETLPVRLIGAVAQGWAEESHAHLAQDGCEDPLSGLVTVPYLRTPEYYAATRWPTRTACSWSGCRAAPTRGTG